MEKSADLIEPIEGLDTFNIDHAFYVEVERPVLQEALRTLHRKILSMENGGSLAELEQYLREAGFEKKAVDNAFEIMNLYTEDLAYAQCRVDALEEARAEKQFIQDAGGKIYYQSIIDNILQSTYPKCHVKLKSKHFKESPSKERLFYFNFSERIKQELKNEFHI